MSIHDATEEPSLRELMKKLGNDSRLLMQQELELMRTEVAGEMNALKRASVSIALGAALLHGGFLLVLFGITLALGLVVPLWLSLVIVAGVSCAVGVALLMRQKSILIGAADTPRRAVAHLRDDVDAIKGAM
jgi:hypothetical protein